jgi:AraC-like DNA-binding protein
VRGLADPVERDHYLSSIAEQLHVSQSAFDQKFEKMTGQKAPERQRTIKSVPQKLDAHAIENQKLQDKFLALGTHEANVDENFWIWLPLICFIPIMAGPCWNF